MRIIGWARDMIIILGMWCIWLTREYVVSEAHANIMTGFLITIIAIIVLIKEYVVSVDAKIQEFERDLAKVKQE